MKAKIKSIELIDFENWHYYPDDISNFCVSAEAIIGAKGSEGADIFSFQICTPKWLEQNKNGVAVFVRHLLLVSEYDEVLIKQTVADLVSGIAGENWSEIAQKLARHMFWEFEDYQP